MMNESKIAGNDSSFLKTLAEYIATQLEEKEFCFVSEDHLKRCWPSNQMLQAELNNEIHCFADSHGLSATILKGAFGTKAIFQKLEPGAVDHEGFAGGS